MTKESIKDQWQEFCTEVFQLGLVYIEDPKFDCEGPMDLMEITSHEVDRYNKEASHTS